MKQTTCIRTALLSLAVALTFGVGFTSCSEKEPEELILGTWTLSTTDVYLDDALIAKVDLDNHTATYYNDGKVTKTATIGDIVNTFVFEDKETCYMMEHTEEGSDRTYYTYSIETVNGEKHLLLTEDGETVTAIINTLKKKELVITAIEEDEDGTHKFIAHYKK